MRVSRDAAVQNRQRVVDTASRAFRERGFEGIGISELMRSAGLTHGGFYKQFADKEALAVEATAAALQDNQAKRAEAVEGASHDPLRALAAWYLRPEHMRQRGEGCTFAALAAEAPRHGPEMAKVFAYALKDWVATLAEATPTAERAAILRAVSTMVGALILARAAGDDPIARELVGAAAGEAPGRTSAPPQES